MTYNLDRDEHPKNAGDRAYGHGDTVTLELAGDDDVEGGDFVDLVGDGTVDADPNGDGSLEYEAVAKHGAEVGDDLAVHLRGVVRVGEDASGSDWPVIDDVDGDDLIVLR